MGLSQFEERAPYLVAANLDPFLLTGSYQFVNNTVPLRLDRVVIGSTSVTDQTVHLVMTMTGSGLTTPQVTVPTAAGQGTVPAVDLMPTMTMGGDVLILPVGSSVALVLDTTLATGETLTLFVSGGTL